ncbi:Peptidase M15 [Desulfonauticus submarinus]|uniref:Peptidase M15 n=1 Tax=Desulfonauticus submarinus TaxID=206665 RepID=A0A1H0GBF9_9BACT|nr:D-Ala-D-Ala carboxypeptidase family metallohydrolase [Desulfonauticus submarinus]SDO04213.1 Peptidase M15 [Desulfonauticus submarinus]
MNWENIRHFKPHEFKCPCCGRCEIKEEAILALDMAREMAGVPFRITSGFRCEKHNREVGGKPDSAHLGGWAVDIRATNSKARYKIITALINCGFTRIGIGKNFIHADKDPEKVQNVVWVY